VGERALAQLCRGDGHWHCDDRGRRGGDQFRLGQGVPWTLPGWAVKGNLQGEAIATSLALSIVGGIAIALVGGWDVIRRDVL